MIAYTVRLAGEFTTLNPSDLFLWLVFWIVSIVVAWISQAIIYWHLRLPGAKKPHHSLAIVSLACKREHELPLEHLKSILGADALLLVGFIGTCTAIAFSIPTADRPDVDELNFFCFVVLWVLALVRQVQCWCHYCYSDTTVALLRTPLQHHEDITDIKEGKGGAGGEAFSSPFGCAMRKAATLLTGAVGLKTAGVARPATRFNFA
jgi:hypothetical protein